MTTSLDDLFNQIIHSELHAQQKKKYHHDLKCRIQSTLARKDGLQKKHKELQRELICKTNLLIQEEVNLKCLDHREQILRDEKAALETEKQRVQKCLIDTQHRKSEALEGFCRGVRGFIQGYGLQSGGHQRRKEEHQKVLEEAKQTAISLRAELDVMKERHRSLEEMEKQLNNEQQRHQNLQKTKEDLDGELKKLKDQTDILTARKTELNMVPHTDPEFLSLSKDLEIANGERLEEKCMALQQELQRLQQILWQKQVRERKRLVASSQQHPQQRSVAASQQQPPKEKLIRTELETNSNRMTVSNFSTGEDIPK
ncbi:moesin/ezrin/radixin homolog 1-like [Saccostrea cucullata]|uniref:moesin/ezrin/radixin homolog 1-like n=1 Tax=Saccostrea cuccullata TaxID=36930 RepID=UPI002ED4864E